MTKQCGTCKWWDGINKSNGDGRYMGMCTNPEVKEEFMINDQGQDCPCYHEESKG